MNARTLLLPALLLSFPGTLRVNAATPTLLDTMDDIGAWKATASDVVKASLRQVAGTHGKAICLDYDFNGVSGYAVARRPLPLDYPANFQFTFDLRGSGLANNLEIKLSDSSGENVWWMRKPDMVLPAAWMPVKMRKRQIEFAWGPAADHALRHSAALELVISAGKGGGAGEVCVDNIAFAGLPVDDAAPLHARSTASQADAGHAPEFAVDDDSATAWSTSSDRAELTLDLGRSREFGGLVLHWLPARHASTYRVQFSEDGRAWRDVRKVEQGNGGQDALALPESEARWVRLLMDRGPGTGYALANVAFKPLAFSATTNDLLRSIAGNAKRGRFPRGLSGEQPYWTVIGINGGTNQGLIGEDGAIEFGKGGFSIEPFLLDANGLASWAEVRATQALADGYLPIPAVEWRRGDSTLQVTAFAQGTAANTTMVARYRIRNGGASARDVTLALAVRPMQVNPPSQFLNTTGGFSPIHRLDIDGSRVSVDGRLRVLMSEPPTDSFATPFDAGMVEEHLGSSAVPKTRNADDAAGLASGALLYRLHLKPGETREIDLTAPLTGGLEESNVIDAETAQQAVAVQWREKLNRVRFDVPAQAQDLVDTLRTALANMLISRSGPRLQPGTRSYARAWIRDGAMISEGLLRLGHAQVAEDFLRWYAPFQFANGKVPCCVDDRGSDPVPENDSQGEFIYTVAEIHRHGGDMALLEAMWPHVQAAVRYMDELRASERQMAKPGEELAFRGLMPASISHEGYSAKPMHSYWDDFWALRGYKDAVDIAVWLGHDAEARAFAGSRDQFRADLYASLRTVTSTKRLAYLPGSAELGDFDPTSSTIALAPGGEQAALPQDLLLGSFERYWSEFVQRRDGAREWKDYTPYELRTVGTFVRLGWRDRAWRALEFFLADRQPVGWNQWAEVVSRTPRKPFFLGDLPHAWVASDYLRSVLDMFAYTREEDQALVIAAGVPSAWLDGEGVAIHGLRTPYGKLGYTLARSGRQLHLRLDAGTVVPPGGFILPWPGPATPGKARVNGKPASWEHGELRIRSAPADVVVDAAR